MLLLFAAAANAGAQPCATPTAECTEWVGLAAGQPRVLIYRSYPLAVKNEGITRALVIVHGGSRDADNHFRTALAAAFLAGALTDTVLIAPRFASNTGESQNSSGAVCRDRVAPDEAVWTCNDGRPESWRFGGPATGNNQVTAFDYADEILRKLANKTIFPNLKRIVFSGHSGGGMFTLRYAMASDGNDKLGVPVTYVASNATNVTYLDSLRPTAAAYPVTAAAPGYVPLAPSSPFVPFPDAKNCATFDDWPFGLKHRVGYSARIPDSQLIRQMAARNVISLLGDLEILPLASFDVTCPAMAQGPTRLARGLALTEHLNRNHGAHHKAVVVPNCGHNARCMFTADVALPLLFPEPRTGRP